MKKPEDLAAMPLTSADEHKRRGTTLRRVAGGIEAQLSGPFELSAQEKTLLQEAARLLNRMANISLQAAKLRQRANAAAEARRTSIKAAAASTFGSLSSVADKVALVAAVQSYSLRANSYSLSVHPHALEQLFAEAQDGLVWTLAGSDLSTPHEVLVSQAWQKFLDGRDAILAQYKEIIAKQQQLHGESTS